MRNEHRDIQNWIEQKYRDSFTVLAEVNRRNNLPDTERHWYQPDVILGNPKGEIEYIIEVENDPMRKAIVGASILADACIREIQQSCKPTLIFVVYMPQRVRQIPNFESKIEIVRPYCKNLGSIEVYSIDEFKHIKLLNKTPRRMAYRGR
jgi:hypothetical protein